MNLEKALDIKRYYEDEKVVIILKETGLNYISGVIFFKLGYILNYLLKRYTFKEVSDLLKKYFEVGIVEFKAYSEITEDIVGFMLEKKGEVLPEVREDLEEYCKVIYEYACKRIDEELDMDALLEDMLIYTPSNFEEDLDDLDDEL